MIDVDNVSVQRPRIQVKSLAKGLRLAVTCTNLIWRIGPSGPHLPELPKPFTDREFHTKDDSLLLLAPTSHVLLLYHRQRSLISPLFLYLRRLVLFFFS
jgi:hypothetical protein